MKLQPPVLQYLEGTKPSHCPKVNLSKHIKLFKQAEIEQHLVKAGYLTSAGKATKEAATAGLIDSCEGKLIWNVKKTTKVLLELTRKAPKEKKEPPKLIVPQREKPTGPVWTDLENIGTYFGVGKNKIGTWLDELGLRAYEPMQVNESGDIDMLDVANASKEKFKLKIPTEKALQNGLANMEVIEYTQKGKEKSFNKYSWDRDRIKDILVRAGHPLDTERKLLHKGKGKNSDIKVESLDDRAAKVYAEWKKLHGNPKTRAESWKLFDKKPKPLLMRVEMLMGRPRYLVDQKWKTEPI